MLDFIIMTLSIALGIILATVVMFVLMLQPKVIKIYTKFIMKYMENVTKISEEEMKDL